MYTLLKWYFCITGKQAVSDCIDCPGGKYCLTTGSSNITNDCDPGYYCIGAAFESNPTGIVHLCFIFHSKVTLLYIEYGQN
jgi:hypothetical protein